jgi:glycosyltransferase involved in cell wall biosynthesis
VHVLIISTYFPYPVNCGKAKVLTGLCNFLSAHGRIDRISYIHVSKTRNPGSDKLPVSYIHINGPTAAEAAFNFIKGLITCSPVSLQESLTFSRKAKRDIKKFIDANKPNLVIADTIRAAQYVENDKSPSTRYFIYLDDLFSVRYARILDNIDRFSPKEINPLGNFSSFIPAGLAGLVDNRTALRILLSYEKARTRDREIVMTGQFEKCFLISSEEVETLRHRAGANNVFQLKMLLDGEAHPFEASSPEKYFVFLGDLELAHNHLSILNFIRKTSCSLPTALPGYKIIIIGKGAKPDLVAACANTPFIIAGYIDDLEGTLKNSRGMLAPLLFGSGVKIKCLDSLKLGVPVIATRFGVEGLGIRPEHEYLHANTAEETVSQMQRLTLASEYERFSRAGRLWFETNYENRVVALEYERHLVTS